MALSTGSPLLLGGVVKCRVLRVSDALCVAGFGLALLRLVWSDSSWRALSNGGTFVQIGGVFSFEVLLFVIDFH